MSAQEQRRPSPKAHPWEYGVRDCSLGTGRGRLHAPRLSAIPFDTRGNQTLTPPPFVLHRSAATMMDVEDRVREAGPGRALRQGAGWVRDGGRENTVALCSPFHLSLTAMATAECERPAIGANYCPVYGLGDAWYVPLRCVRLGAGRKGPQNAASHQVATKWKGGDLTASLGSSLMSLSLSVHDACCWCVCVCVLCCLFGLAASQSHRFPTARQLDWTRGLSSSVQRPAPHHSATPVWLTRGCGRMQGKSSSPRQRRRSKTQHARTHAASYSSKLQPRKQKRWDGQCISIPSLPSMHSSASIHSSHTSPRTPARFETHRISGFPMLAAVCDGSTGTPPDRDPTSSAISLSTHWPCMPLERTNRGHASPPAGNSKGCDTGIQSIPGHLLACSPPVPLSVSQYGNPGYCIPALTLSQYYSAISHLLCGKRKHRRRKY